MISWKLNKTERDVFNTIRNLVSFYGDDTFSTSTSLDAIKFDFVGHCTERAFMMAYRSLAKKHFIFVDRGICLSKHVVRNYEKQYGEFENQGFEF